MNLRKLRNNKPRVNEPLSVFIISEHNINMKYACDTMLMSGAEGELKDHLLKESKTKGLLTLK